MKILILVADGVDVYEYQMLHDFFKKREAAVVLASPERGKVKTWGKDNWASSIYSSQRLSEVSAAYYDAVVIPSGEMHAMRLLGNEEAGHVVRAAHSLKRVIGASRYGVALLVSTGIVQGLTVTSCESLKTFVVNAGAEWSSNDIEDDQGVITAQDAGVPKLARAVLDAIPIAEELRERTERQYGKILEHA